MKKFIALFDLHYGKERTSSRHYRPIHDERAMGAVMAFIADFKPDALIWGGDQLDCSAISHWTRNKRREIEGLRIIEDIRGFQETYLYPIDRMLPPDAERRFLIGNHEAWLDQLSEEYPGLDGMLDLDVALGLSEMGYTVVPQGGTTKLGKLHFLHGDVITGGKYRATAAILAYERSVRFGHFHRFEAATKHTALDITDVRTAVIVPCLCRRGPSFDKGKPNQWMTGFNWGYIHADGTFNDYVTIITNGRFSANGKTYRG